MKHNKLVRDHLPHHITADGRKCEFHKASDQEFQTKLLQKFFDDVKSFLNATQLEDKKEKLADLHEVCEHLMEWYGIEKEEVRIIKQSKKLQLWSFAEKWILDEEEILLAG